ncbi:fibronectin type III domain-containing protein [Geosporobacter ferrireducens]|uniref:fibronectin type III domain-containing protein n=1 Tax=Geosporobacter ferrireducens TaxID=1424294 RepID=UPI00139BA221|nr:fibronectin type III domain-containing protein [Geosporobacter ferrireducens]MTI54990.1 hypothetical protein [Geosporobacter ferrireducens]
MKTIKLFLTMLVCVGIIFSGIVPGMYIYANPDTVLLAAPTNLTAEIKTPTQVLLNWNFINSELANIYIERKSGGGTFEVIAVISGGTNVYTDSGLAPNTTYIYQVKAVYDSDAGESAYSNTVSATTPPEAVDPPSRPTNLTAAAVSSAQINLSWTKTGREDGYEIERKKIGGNYEIIGNLNGNTTTYTDSGLAPGATYYYRIRSHNSGGYSPFSNEATATTPSIVVNAPAKPSNLTAVVPANDRINLTWNDNANDESGFKIERKVGNGNYVEIMILGANTTSYSDLGLSPNASYSYRVSAYNGGGNSGYSNEVSVKTEIAPSAPTNLSASVISNSRIELSWTDRSNNETGFKIERKTGSGSYEEIATVGANKTGYTDTGLSSNVTYTYRIRAYNSAGNSGYSNEVSGKTGNVPSTPTNLSASVTSNSRIELSWTDRSNNETGFKIERKTGSGSYEEIATVGANKTGYTDTGLSSNVTYTYRIRAYNSAGNSGYSNVSSANIPIDSDQIQIRLYIGNTVYYVEDELKEMDAAPIIREGRTLLPIKYVAEAIGAKVAWSNTEKKVTVTQNKKVIELWIDRNTARVDGKRMLIDPDNKDVKPIIIPPGRTMVPLRFIVENLGCKVDWNGNIQEVKVTYPQN